MSKYENHEHEWREEDNQRIHDQHYIPWVDPRDPNYIVPEDDEE